MYGVIDIGSNTIRLVLYKLQAGQILPMLNKKEPAGLAGYVEKNNLTREGIEKSVTVLTQFKNMIANIAGIKETFPFATASLRNIDNTEEVLKEIAERTGFEVRVFTGKEEALFDYYGAVQSTELKEGLLLDIGGGSTELVLYQNKKVLFTDSIPLGSLNLFNKMVEGILPTKEEFKAIENETLAKLSELDFPPPGLFAPAICGIGGTARATLALMGELHELEDKNPSYSHDQLVELLQLLYKDERRFVRYLLKSSPDRIHTLVPGLIILQTIAGYCGAKAIFTSPYGVREGYLHYILKERKEI